MKHDFHYISKKDPKVRETYSTIQRLIHEVQDLVRDKFTFQYTIVGSYKRNMITYDAKSNVGYDFDFNIEVNDEDEEYSPKEIKNILRNAFDKVVWKYGYDYAEDSTRVLTIKMKNMKKSLILHSCDFAIVYNYIDNEENECQQYIHFNKNKNTYTWCNQPDSYRGLPEKIEWIKENNLWQGMRDLYIQKKNKNENPRLHSRSILASAIHEICQKKGFYQ